MPGLSRKCHNWLVMSGTVAEMVRTHMVNLCRCCLLLYLLASFVCWPAYWLYSSAEPSRVQSRHKRFLSRDGQDHQETKVVPGQFSYKFPMKKGMGVNDLGITDQSSQSPEPRIQLNPCWLLLGLPQPSRQRQIQLDPHIFLPASTSLAYFYLLQKLQGINHFLWIPVPAQISLPGREIFADIQLNSSLFNTLPSHGAKQKAPRASKPPQCGPVGTSPWVKSRHTADVPSLHHTASTLPGPFFSFSPSFNSYLTSRWWKHSHLLQPPQPTFPEAIGGIHPCTLSTHQWNCRHRFCFSVCALFCVLLTTLAFSGLCSLLNGCSGFSQENPYCSLAHNLVLSLC